MSSNNYKNILLIGATGNVGKPVFQALLADSTFRLSVLSRANSNATFPSNVNVIKVDYSDTAALTKALTNQDVVISTIGGEGLASNFGEILIQAAIDAKVKWLIPSEFGIDLDDPAVNIPLLGSKVSVNNLLKQNQSKLAYTLITTGPFLDWGLANGFLGFDVKNRTATLYDQGQNQFSGATLATIANTIVAILHKPEVALNKRVYVADATFTQQQALNLFEKYTNNKWTVKNIATADARKDAEASLAQGNIGAAFVGYILSYVYGGSKGTVFDGKAVNQQLGVPTVSLDQIVQQIVKQ